MNSIKSKLFLQIGSIVLILVSLLIVMNSVFLDDYYVFIHKNNILKIYETLKDYQGPDYRDEVSALLFNEHKVKIEVLIRNEDGIKYSSNPQLEALIEPRSSRKKHDGMPPKLVETESEIIDDNTSFIYAIDQNSNMHFVLLDGQLDNGDLINILMPVESVLSNSRIVNDFLMIIGAIVFIFSMSMAYLISKSFTRPILKINDAAKSMINHDFDVSCQIEGRDEISQLATNINALAIALDNSIKDLKLKNAALEIQIDETHRLATQRKVLLGNVSHELKTPLSLIQGYAEGLEVLTDSDAKAKKYASIIHDESRKMNTLICKLLDIDQLESHTLILDTRRFDLVALIHSTIFALDNLIKVSHSHIICQLPSKLFVVGDPLLIERVLLNLLTNALYHGTNQSSIQVYLEEENDMIRVNIVNSSHPLSESELSNLFESFYKVDQARTRHGQGHGLGLAIVKAIIEAHKMNYGVKQNNNLITFWFEVEKNKVT